METKHILALICMVALTSGGVLLTLYSQRMRDAALFFMIFGAVFVRKFMDVSFFGEFWYRGTSRGFEISGLDLAAWCLLLSHFAAPRYGNRRWFWPAGFGLLTLYFLYCCVSVATSAPQIFGAWELTRILRGLLILITAALVIRTKRELAVVVVALGCAVWFLGLNAIEQRVWKGVLRPPATMDHENSLSMYLCTISPVLLAATMANWSIWLRIFAGASCLLAALTEMMTLSRAGIPIFGFVMAGTALFCMSWRITLKKIQLAFAAFVAGAMMLFLSWDALMRRYAEQSLTEEFMAEEGFETRGSYWRKLFAILDERPLMGVGLNNWSYHVSKTYAAHVGFKYNDYDEMNSAGGDRAEADVEAIYAPPAHSIIVITWGELGIIGLVIFGMVWLRWFQVGATFLRGRLNPDPMHRMGIGFLFGTCGVFLQSQTEWTYRQTAMMFTFHLMMGALASLYYERRARQAAIEEEIDDEAEDEIEIEATPVAVSAVRQQA